MKKVDYLSFCSKCGHPKEITPFAIRMYGSFVCSNSINRNSSEWVKGYYPCGESNELPDHLTNIVDELETTLNQLNTPKLRGKRA